MMLFAIVLGFVAAAMALMAIGTLVTGRALERRCGKVALGLGECDCRSPSRRSAACEYRRREGRR